MKNTFFILLGGLLLSSSIYAQKKKSSPSVKQVNVPENVSTSFKGLYTIATENKWNKNYSGNYVANFTNSENLKQTVEFSESGSMIKSKTEYAPDAIPSIIGNAITTQYPTTKVTEAARFQLPGVAPYYRVKVLTAENTSKELLISEEGTITE
ncbi:MAG: PepSY-like domain-containing protein [Ferruginibacter sp.]|nr:PepSY-like domain-containing protein [Ferruginibacter sp.]